MQHVNGVPVHNSDPSLLFKGLNAEPTWFSAQGGVYRCTNRKTHKPVAIKKYLVEENRHKDMFVMPKELVENEIYTMTKCIHPNILKLLAVHLHDEFVYLIMPLCAGGSLQQYVFEHHLSVGQLANIVSAVAAGLAEIHRHGYIHRDIKCDNIFLDSDTNSIVIGDFGVVSITPAADSKVEEAGVVLFWSPELVQQRIVNHKIDIWALGIVILEILNGGRAPYEDEKLDEEEIKQRIIDHGKPDYPDGLPSRLIDLLDRCLEPDPQKRATADSVLQHPFLRHYEPEPLFPAHQVDNLSLSDSEHTVEADEDMDDNVMATALKKLKALQALHEFDIELPSLDRPKPSQPNPSTALDSFPPAAAPVATRATKQPARMPRHIPSAPQKCRLPLPAFVIDKDQALAIPAPERVANVLRKRQSMTEASRNQGSRLPVLILSSPAITPVFEEPPMLTKKDLQTTKTKAASEQQHRIKAPPASSKRLTAQQPLRAKSPAAKIPPSPTAAAASGPEKLKRRAERMRARSEHRALTGAGHNETPKTEKPIMSPRSENVPPPPMTDSSARTKLRIPQSRTARLVLGISANGRCYSNKDIPIVSEDHQSPGHLAVTTISEKPKSDKDKKPRPASLIGSISGKGPDNVAKRIGPASPRWQHQTNSRRQSAPVPAKNETSLGKASSLKGAKALRVH